MQWCYDKRKYTMQARQRCQSHHPRSIEAPYTTPRLSRPNSPFPPSQPHAAVLAHEWLADMPRGHGAGFVFTLILRTRIHGCLDQ
jgi:hypothetical protein